ncbi:MAG: cation:dicarboxylase symporter family transporter, partial [Eggerthellaceae bacterium]|nr:cation:dicarboxylase symporter family transporter [Eggerthellaceae bacterium]
MSKEILHYKGEMNLKVQDMMYDTLINYLKSNKFGKRRCKFTMMHFTNMIRRVNVFLEEAGNNEIDFTMTKTFAFIVCRIALEDKELSHIEVDMDKPELFEFDDRLSVSFKRQYQDGKNVAIVKIPLLNHISMLSQIIVGLALAAIGAFVASFFPAEQVSSFNSCIVDTLLKKMVAIFQGFASPLVFLAVISGVSSLSDIYSFGRIGKNFLKNFSFAYLIAFIVCVLSATVFLDISFGPSSAGEISNGQYNGVFELVVDMVPGNLITPFATDDLLQIVVLGVFLGIVLLIFKPKIQVLGKFLDELNGVINVAMSIICKIVPFLVFVGILDILLKGDFYQLIDAWQIVLLCALCVMVILVVLLTKTKLVTKSSLVQDFNDQLPATIINLTTSSQITSYPVAYECLVEKWGIPNKIVDFLLPVCMVIYMPCGVIFVFYSLLYAVQLSGIVITFDLVVFGAILSVI